MLRFVAVTAATFSVVYAAFRLSHGNPTVVSLTFFAVLLTVTVAVLAWQTYMWNRKDWEQQNMSTKRLEAHPKPAAVMPAELIERPKRTVADLPVGDRAPVSFAWVVVADKTNKTYIVSEADVQKSPRFDSLFIRREPDCLVLELPAEFSRQFRRSELNPERSDVYLPIGRIEFGAPESRRSLA